MELFGVKEEKAKEKKRKTPLVTEGAS